MFNQAQTDLLVELLLERQHVLKDLIKRAQVNQEVGTQYSLQAELDTAQNALKKLRDVTI